MCDGMKILEELKPEQEPVECTSSTLCWCNQLSFRHPMEQIQDECLSPTEILKTYKSELSKKDIAYLSTLSSREFIPN